MILPLPRPLPNCDANYNQRTKGWNNGEGRSTTGAPTVAKSKIETQTAKSRERSGAKNLRARRISAR